MAKPGSDPNRLTARARIVARGVVQGVGFRPFVFRLATELGVSGEVFNTAHGVVINIEGPKARLDDFLIRVGAECPPHSSIQSLETTWLDPVGYTDFVISPSDSSGEKTALILPDIATCAACVRDIFEAGNRRAGYPFTNCTHCGPRFSIIRTMPYDRANTSMSGFQMCAECRAEYEDPRNRRFHAQPNACPSCGPHVELWDAKGRPMRDGPEALETAAQMILEGAIVALKGLGGFHLMVLACDDAAVERLRVAKCREEKPFAVMFPSLEDVVEECEVSALEQRLLLSPEAPIVILRGRGVLKRVCRGVAPGNPNIGAMLPYTPLHHLLLARLGVPVVATSGNRKDEPICIDEKEAMGRLCGMADFFLVHNRPIVRHVDDSVVRVVGGRELVLRRARGYAPLPIMVMEKLRPTIAYGAHLKNTIALARGRYIFLSQHIGDLDTAEAVGAHVKVGQDLQRLLDITPEIVASDKHPDYASTRTARGSGKHVVCVQHHYAHVLACMAENDLPAPVLGVAWDGTGLGTDMSIWGGEFLRVTENSFQRVARLRTFPLPGGDKAIKEPRRAALGLLYELYGDKAFSMSDLPTIRAFKAGELKSLKQMLRNGINCPRCSSAGRLFDAVASLAGFRQHVGFEGQAAIDLEFAVEQDDSDDTYPIVLRWPSADQPAGASQHPCPVHKACTAYEGTEHEIVLDWGPMLERLISDLRAEIPVWGVSARFHNTLAEGITKVAEYVREPKVVLTGGCFQNKCLLERTIDRLRSAGFKPYWHQRVPPNDGGIALGQIIASQRESYPEQPCV
ncbi:MAG: carbamoyltransferase HypF [Verrucomicrobiae bacterium]|nr:carbamoyltransferase HypF [Verrucomicrobiae bacterium]